VSEEAGDDEDDDDDDPVPLLRIFRRQRLNGVRALPKFGRDAPNFALLDE